MIFAPVRTTQREKVVSGVCCPEERLDIVRAALLVASEEYPGLDIEGYEARVARLGDGFASRSAGATAEDAVMLLGEYLFGEHGFRGNSEDYYDPRNTFLNDVLDRRVGIPISLAAIYIDVARRAGFEASGVSFPAHFLVRIDGDDGPFFVDPFNSGIRLGRRDCQDRLDKAFSGRVKLTKDMLAPCTKRAMLVRMLRNLRNIYLKKDDHERALRTVDMILLADPKSRSDKRDRGLILGAMGCYALAADTLEEYLALAPGVPEAPTVGEKIVELRRAAARIN